VRHFDANAFAQEYRWFRNADYPGIANGELIIVAASVRGREGGELIPGNRVAQ
jgi:hypothetical protein